MYVKESEIKTIIWHDPENNGMPVPIGIFPPPIPDEVIGSICKLLQDTDPEGKYANSINEYIAANELPETEHEQILNDDTKIGETERTVDVNSTPLGTLSEDGPGL
jgi:hypothetical protein